MNKDNHLISEAYTLKTQYFYKIGFNVRGPWKTKETETVFAKSLIDAFLKTQPVYKFSEFDIDFKSDNSLVLSIPAECTLVISTDPSEVEKLYLKYNQDTGTNWA